MTALAIFVKTPGLSPLKTRLAAGIGPERAAAFYRLAVQAVADVVGEVDGLVPYWAVAEDRVEPIWSGFPVIFQGEGGLGARLDHVYAELLSRHGRVLLIGADAPQLQAGLLREAATSPTPFVMGRAVDGGFWLFGGSRPIPAAIWQGVGYSAGDTADRLLEAVAPLEEVGFLPALQDVDHAEDLGALRLALAKLDAPTRGQMALADWLEDLPRA